MVLHVNGSVNQLFVMNGKKASFHAMINSGSPITTFTQADLRKVLKVDVIFARLMPKKRTTSITKRDR